MRVFASVLAAASALALWATPASASTLPDCEAPATPIAIGQTIQSETTAGEYPEGARYFCFAAPEGVMMLIISLSGMNSDLDLYVGMGSISSVLGKDLIEGQTYTWTSRNAGIVEDTVALAVPAAGIYYVEVVSYTIGSASPFTLSVQ